MSKTYKLANINTNMPRAKKTETKTEKPAKVEKVAKVEKPIEEKEIGIITHFFDKISVAVVELSGELKVGETIHIKGATTDFTQKVDSMQVEHDKIATAKKGQAIGMKTKEIVRVHDKVFVVK